ncbi:hypothetical protein GSU75_04591 [Pseudomonas savastanoi pv. phaseolicola]|uniref:hypothetical protein n=1 Tax=Pseudomonas savastanoi TaxID=29438 RepID=UPI001605579D|nr:hypothetical protein [Pseudomonas savastanoi]MBN4177318.1 hypothetical protein [Pseudomonas savastanoi pv. phaseolicola]
MVITFEKSVLPNEYGGGCGRMIASVRLFSKVANVLKVAMMAKSSNKNSRAVACITTAEY